jgi:dihydrofolate reductase
LEISTESGYSVSAMTHERKIIVSVATSADGFIGRSDGSVDWLDRPVPKGNYGLDAFYKSIDTILWGRKTCDMALRFQAEGIPGSAFDTNVKNYVFTHTSPPNPVPKGVEFVDGPVKPFADRLRAVRGKTSGSWVALRSSPHFLTKAKSTNSF